MSKEISKRTIDVIVSVISSVSGLRPQDIDLDATFSLMGIESLQALNIIDKLSQEFDRELTSGLMFDFPNIRSLAQHLDGHAVHQGKEERRIYPQTSSEPVAIIGMSCSFPGAETLEAFWSLLKKGDCAITEIPEDRPELSILRSGQKNHIPWGGFLKGIDEFDAESFGISAPEASKMDPQQRLLLMATWHAMEDAGYSPKDFSQSKTGVYIGISSSDYSTIVHKNKNVFDATGNAHSISANRISYQFNLKGPSLAIDTACSSSLVALHEAKEAIRRGDIDTAVVGGVNIILNPELSIAFAMAGMLSADGKCKTFSDDADGYVRGEGVGVVILKSLAKAQRDGDRVYSLVLGSAVNQDGMTNGLTAPNGRAQEEVIKSALDNAKLDPDEIGMIEAHGTGTSLGDPIEFLALTRVFGRNGDPLKLGSVKTNIGHLEAAAGIAGLIKSTLSIYHQWIPPTLHFKELNRKIGSHSSSLVAQTKGSSWNVPFRKVGVSSFGFGGTNAHVVLGEPTTSAKPKKIHETLFPTIAFSTATASELPETARSWLTYLEKNKEVLPSPRLNLKMKHFLIGKDVEEIRQDLVKLSQGEKVPNLVSIKGKRKGQVKLAFLFTGQGSQYVGMGQELYGHDSTFRHHFESCCEEFNRHLNEDLSQVIFNNDFSDDLLNQTDYAQAAIFTLSYSLAMTLKSRFNFVPDLLIGHSLGEITAATFAGAITLSDAARLVAMRGRLMQGTAPGKMLSVHLGLDDLTKLLWEHQIELDIAAINGAKNISLSGVPEAIALAENVLNKQEIKSSLLKVTRAFHSSLMDPVLNDFEKFVSGIKFYRPEYPIISGLTGKEITEPYNASYWKAHLRSTTLFSEGLETLVQKGINTFIEMGPHPTLSVLGQLGQTDSKFIWLNPLKRGESQLYGWHRFLASLHGHDLINLFQDAEERHRFPPVSIFHKSRFWQGERQHTHSNIKHETIQMKNDEKILSELRSMVAHLLQMEAHEVNVDEPLLDSGADSLLLLNAVQNIKDQYGVDVAISDIFYELSTIRKISDHIGKQKPAEPQIIVPVYQPTLQLQNSEPNIQMMLQMQQMMLNMQQMMMGQTQSLPQVKPQVTPSAPAEGKGVLGMFKSQAVRTVVSEEAKKTEAYLKKMKQAFIERTATSKKQTQDYRRVLADNRVSAGFRPNLKEMVYPIIFKDAAGSRFHDLDDNEYVDFTMGFGVNLFGHNPKFVVDVIKEQLDIGMAVGPQSSLAGRVAKLLTELTGHDRIAFFNSGTEAVMTAIRLARAATKRDKLVIFNGSYHGHFDGVLSRPSSDKTGMPVAPGIVSSFSKDVIVLEYGDPEALTTIRSMGHLVAAVLVEPVQSRFPEHQPKEFLRELRKVTEEFGSALIFDEVITGFRIKTGGAQAHFGVKADIASYGKILGGGMPIGAVGGSEKFMNPIDGGYWEFGNDSFPSAEMTFFAGTFCKHPLAMAAAKAVLEKMKHEGHAILETLTQKTTTICEKLNQFFRQEETEITVNNFGSLFRFKANANLDLFFYELNLRGVYVWEGRNLFLSTAHTEKDIETFIKTVEAVTRDLLREGILRKKSQR
jgi:acyl transferase domain-containing protein